jgi:hypothetical protein
MVTAVLFTIVKLWKWSKYQTTNEWMNNESMVYAYVYIFSSLLRGDCLGVSGRRRVKRKSMVG